jgi:hypothetical protein
MQRQLTSIAAAEIYYIFTYLKAFAVIELIININII